MRNFFCQNDKKQNKSLFSGFSKQLSFVLFSFFLLTGIIKPLFGQSTESEKIDFSVENQKLSSVLVMLSVETGINFSYNSDESLFDTKITYDAENKSPLIILEDLLKDTNHGFKKIGNQIVIFQNSSKAQEPVVAPVPVVTIKEEPKIITEYITTSVYDTVFVTDTLVKYITDTLIKFKTDTLIQIKTDTVFLVDTVFVEKEKPKKPQPNKIKEIPIDYFNKQELRESGWSGGIYIAPILSDFSLVREEDKITIRSFSLGAEVTKIQNNWNFKANLQLTHFGEKFNHSYIFTDGGFFVTDTIDEYYTVVQNDTTYYYVTDSTWKPVDSQEYNYAINNRIGLLEIGLSVSYDFYTSQNARFYGRLGANIGFIIYSNGFALPYPEQPEGVDFADLSFATQSISAVAGIGMKYRINKHFDFNPEIYYSKYFNNIVEDYPASTKITGIGVKFGLIYYF